MEETYPDPISRAFKQGLLLVPLDRSLSNVGRMLSPAIVTSFLDFEDAAMRDM